MWPTIKLDNKIKMKVTTNTLKQRDMGSRVYKGLSQHELLSNTAIVLF